MRPATIAKIVTLVLGAAILAVGIYSYFGSAWTAKAPVETFHVYEICSNMLYSAALKLLGRPCPSISLERYFVAIIIICFIVSFVSLCAEYALNPDSSTFQLIDLVYHVVAALLLFIAAIVYIVSASQISGIVEIFEYLGNRTEYEAMSYNFRTGEKLIAGALTIGQSMFYGVVAFLIVR